MKHQQMLKQVEDYYVEKLKTHGVTPKGVDWKDLESQENRFTQICKVINSGEPFSINDIGCGFGALASFLLNQKLRFRYFGFDIATEMIAEANKLMENAKDITFLNRKEDLEKRDYSVASGIFNVRLNTSNEQWLTYILESLKWINDLSEKGFSFNLLTSYSDKEKMQDRLYYADPAFFFDYAKRNFSKNVALLHDYGLYEFTVLVRK